MPSLPKQGKILSSFIGQAKKGGGGGTPDNSINKIPQSSFDHFLCVHTGTKTKYVLRSCPLRAFLFPVPFPQPLPTPCFFSLLFVTDIPLLLSLSHQFVIFLLIYLCSRFRVNSVSRRSRQPRKPFCMQSVRRN